MKGLYEFSNPYDQLPAHFLIGTILDVGCGDLSAQLHSNNSVSFQMAIAEKRYEGIDLPNDVRTWKPDRTFDTILCIQMISYIPLEDWKSVFDNLKDWLNPNGRIVLIEAYKKKKSDTLNIYHRTFNIDRHTVLRFLPNTLFYTYQGAKPFLKRFRFVHYLRDFFLGNRKLARYYLRGNISFCAIWNNGGKEVSTD